MKIKNVTHWRSDHLRAIVARVAQDEVEPRKRAGFTVRVKYNRGGSSRASCSGHAAYYGSSITVMVPSGAVDRADLAMVMAHEFAHARGMRHNVMGGSRYNRVGDWRVRYGGAEALPLERKPVKAKVPVSGEWKAEQILQRLKRWLTKKKRAETAIGKLRRRLKHYEKKSERLLAAIQPAIAGKEAP
mgnify:CR=1 FL=1